MPENVNLIVYIDDIVELAIGRKRKRHIKGLTRCLLT